MADDAARRALKERQRERLLSDIARQRDQLIKDNQVRVSADRFVAQHHDVEAQLKIDTVGLVNLDQYRSIRDKLELKRKLDQDAANSTQSIPSSSSKTKKKKKTTVNTATLSFDDDASDLLAQLVVPKKTTKDPSVNTSFLPDREREEQERHERERLRQEWLAEQERIKQLEFTIEYSYWDGNGHRNKVVCKQGDTILHFLEKTRQQWPELRGVAADNLIFVKEDIILPHHLDFYSLIINKVRGKSGPLFDFQIRDDVRLVNDATQEITESHPGKVCQRSWYERNKHIFPASRWELFDPDKQYAEGGYTFRDRGKRATKS